MKTQKIDWNTDNDGSANVRVNDGQVTYFARIPEGTAREEVAGEFIAGYDFGHAASEPLGAEVEIKVTTLDDGASTTYTGRCTSRKGNGGELI